MKNRAKPTAFAFLIVAVALTSGTSAYGQGNAAGADGLKRLKAGNARFVADPGRAVPMDLSRRPSSTDAHTPFAQVLTCSDARVPPEVIFQASVGELHVVRAAGHVADRSVVASLEWGADQLHVPVLVVMGHQSCDTVKAAMEASPASRGPNLDFLLKAIQPSVVRAAAAPEAERLRVAILEHVEETINEVLKASDLLRRRTASREMAVVGAYYEQASGRVLFSEVVDTPIHRPATR